MRTLAAAAWLAGLGVSPVLAAGVVETRLQSGSGGLVLGGLEVTAADSSGTSAGFGASAWSDDALNSTVSTLRAHVSRSRPGLTLGMRGHLVPRVEESEAAGATLFTLWRPADDDPDHSSLWGFDASWVRHDLRVLPAGAPKALKRHSALGEGVAELTGRETFFSEFNFILTGAYFWYDRDLADFRGARPVFLQTDIASLGTLQAVTALPVWSAGLQYARPTSDGGDDASAVFGWTRTEYHARARWVNSWLVGMQYKLGEGLGLEAGYNGVEGRHAAWRSYYGVRVNYYWR